MNELYNISLDHYSVFGLDDSLVQVVQQQLVQQASLHAAELSSTGSELQQAQSAHALAEAHSSQLQVCSNVLSCL